jgi:predicted RNase H-like HicB family nuclease
MDTEMVFEVSEEADGGYSAECLTEDIFTQGETWQELRANVKDVVKAYFFDARNHNGFGCAWSAMKFFQ